MSQRNSRRINQPDFSIFFFRFQLQLNIQQQNLWILEFLWLLLKTSVRECLLERNTIYEERITHGPPRNLETKKCQMVYSQKTLPKLFILIGKDCTTQVF